MECERPLPHAPMPMAMRWRGRVLGLRQGLRGHRAYSPARCFGSGSVGLLVVAARAALDADDPISASPAASHESNGSRSWSLLFRPAD